MKPNLCVNFPPPVQDYMSAVYQDVIEGYLIASIKVCVSTYNEIQFSQDNSNTSFEMSNLTKHSAQLVGWFIFGSLLILKGAFLNYLDDSGLAQPDGSSSARWGRSVEVRQHSFCNADAYDHSHSFNFLSILAFPNVHFGKPSILILSTLQPFQSSVETTFCTWLPDHANHTRMSERF